MGENLTKLMLTLGLLYKVVYRKHFKCFSQNIALNGLLYFSTCAFTPQLLGQALASCVDEVRRRKRDEDELSLPHIHIAYYFYQSRLHNLSRMISLQPEIVSPLRRNYHIRHRPDMVNTFLNFSNHPRPESIFSKCFLYMKPPPSNSVIFE